MAYIVRHAFTTGGYCLEGFLMLRHVLHETYSFWNGRDTGIELYAAWHTLYMQLDILLLNNALYHHYDNISSVWGGDKYLHLKESWLNNFEKLLAAIQKCQSSPGLKEKYELIKRIPPFAYILGGVDGGFLVTFLQDAVRPEVLGQLMVTIESGKLGGVLEFGRAIYEHIESIEGVPTPPTESDSEITIQHVLAQIASLCRMGIMSLEADPSKWDLGSWFSPEPALKKSETGLDEFHIGGLRFKRESLMAHTIKCYCRLDFLVRGSRPTFPENSMPLYDREFESRFQSNPDETVESIPAWLRLFETDIRALAAQGKPLATNAPYIPIKFEAVGPRREDLPKYHPRLDDPDRDSAENDFLQVTEGDSVNLPDFWRQPAGPATTENHERGPPPPYNAEEGPMRHDA
ncbi:hypothetical protein CAUPRSCDRAFT_12138 [Caulochytrium protostelioides]|nr:hypothetical protein CAUPRSCDRAFT_12138 [Caulochytrium protostelioides]